ncbi:hypothetical protein HZA99_01380 [Candidatus Woesearchaeota archaeon]|nr:hypothetical protein [Candidatus Woesearchaeota archaeon]
MRNEDLEQTLGELEQVMEQKDPMNPARMLLLERKYPWGEVCYVHPNETTKGLYLPGDISQRVVQFVEDPETNPLIDRSGRRLEARERKMVAAVVGKLMEVPLMSGLADYGMGLLTGDVGENGKRMIDGEEMDVLVVPQGYRRAAVTAMQMQDAQMKHALAGNAERVLEAMALVMGNSELVAPYCRFKMFADGRNPGVITGEMSAMVTGVTWDFSTKGIVPYLLPRTEKIVGESETSMFTRSEKEGMKAIWRYWQRVAEHIDAMKKGMHDKLFFLDNGLPADMVYTNAIYCGRGREGRVVMAFPECSQGNYFFQGKTQATLFELLQRFGEQEEYGTVPVRVRNPEELAAAFGYEAKGKTGKELSNAVLMEKVDLMLAPGTFRGPQWVHGYQTVTGERKMFETTGSVADAAEAAIRLYNNAVWGLHGGVPTPDGSCMAGNKMYCTVFAKDDLR